MPQGVITGNEEMTNSEPDVVFRRISLLAVVSTDHRSPSAACTMFRSPAPVDGRINSHVLNVLGSTRKIVSTLASVIQTEPSRPV